MSYQSAGPVGNYYDDHARQLAWIQELCHLLELALLSGEAEPVLNAALDHLVGGMQGDAGVLALIDPEGTGAFRVAASVNAAQEKGGPIHLDRTLFERVVQGGQAVLVGRSAGRAPRARHLTVPNVAEGSALYWPLRVGDAVVGILNVQRAPHRHPYSEGDLEHGRLMVDLVTLVVENSRLHVEQRRRIEALSQLNQEVLTQHAAILEMNIRLEDTQNQLLQSEKLASVGLLAAGVAHEINNPIGFVSSNLRTLDGYLRDAFAVLSAYKAAAARAGMRDDTVERLERQIDVDFVRNDALDLVCESRQGIERIEAIVRDLKDFSQSDDGQGWQWAQLNDCLDATLGFVSHEIKYKAAVSKQYGDIPEIQCLPSQLNQVFVNLLINAAQAIDGRGTIAVRTGLGEGTVWLEVVDTGCGIAPENLSRIFAPFYTTKPVGVGTGLGLSLSYSIVRRHGGRFEVESVAGQGSTFRIVLPIRQAGAPDRGDGTAVPGSDGS
ncbi:MAG: GAF domain-containing protein [Burkholderiales bacterium]|nr:GAF domain-containing protein [Burkholderiales bacterium]